MSEGPKLPTEARLGVLRVNFPRPALNLIRKLIKSASHVRVSYCGREFAAFNDLTLDADNQFEVFSHHLWPAFRDRPAVVTTLPAGVIRQ